MKASELRIGNLVIYSNGSILFKVISISEFGIDIENEVEKTYIEYDEFEPIPLTEEWLLKFGFIRHHADYANDVIYIKNVPDNIEFEWGVYPFELGSGFVINNSQKLNYVHQLQNLYFALTGEELVVKE
jgi:hypothetical protein